MKKSSLLLCFLCCGFCFAQQIKKIDLYNIELHEGGTYLISDSLSITMLSSEGTVAASQCSSYILLKSTKKACNILLNLRTKAACTVAMDKLAGLGVDDDKTLYGRAAGENTLYAFNLGDNTETKTDKSSIAMNTDPTEIAPILCIEPLAGKVLYTKLAGKCFVIDMTAVGTEKPLDVRVFDLGIAGLLSVRQ